MVPSIVRPADTKNTKKKTYLKFCPIDIPLRSFHLEARELMLNVVQHAWHCVLMLLLMLVVGSRGSAAAGAVRGASVALVQVGRQLLVLFVVWAGETCDVA